MLLPPQASSGWTSGRHTSPESSGNADVQPAALCVKTKTRHVAMEASFKMHALAVFKHRQGQTVRAQGKLTHMLITALFT